MKKLIYIIFFFMTGLSYAQIETQKQNGIIFSSYTFNLELSKKECKIVSKLNNYIKKKGYGNLPIVVLNLHYSQVINFKNNRAHDNVELAYQTYKNEFLGGNGNINFYDGEHIYINISMKRNHLKVFKELIDYVIIHFETLKNKEAVLRVKEEAGLLSDEDLNSFKMPKFNNVSN